MIFFPSHCAQSKVKWGGGHWGGAAMVFLMGPLPPIVTPLYVCMYASTYIYIHICMYVRTCICMYVCTYLCVYICMYVSVCMYVCLHVCVCVCVCVCVLLMNNCIALCYCPHDACVTSTVAYSVLKLSVPSLLSAFFLSPRILISPIL